MRRRRRRLASRKQVAVIYGVTVRTIINWERSGLIASEKIGGVVRIDLDDLEELHDE